MGAGSKLAERAQKLFPEDVRFKLMSAVFAFSEGDIEKSQELLDRLDEDVINTPIGLKLQGLLNVINQEYASAVKIYEKRYAISPGLKGAMELSSVYVLNDQNDKAIQFLTEVIESNPEKGKALEMKLVTLLANQNPESAIKKYQNIVEQEPANYIALNNLALLLLENGSVKDAQKYAEQAYQLGGEYPQIADTYGYVLLKAGDNVKALDILEDAYSKMQDSPEVGLHYAESLILNNNNKLAKNILAKVITEDPELAQIKGELEGKILN